MKHVTYSLVLVGLLLASSCSEPEEDKKKEYSRPVLDIANAETLALIYDPLMRHNLYKITADGSFDSVKIVNADGSTMHNWQGGSPIVRVDGIYSLNDSYLMLTGDFSIDEADGETQYLTALLVRKDDGVVFNYGEMDLSTYGHKIGDQPFQYDASGNIYYANPGHVGVTKLNVSDPDQITKEPYGPSGQNIYYFNIAQDGAMLYGYEFSNMLTDYKLRLKKASGGIAETEVVDRTNGEFWKGANNSLYFITTIIDNGYLPSIYKIAITGDNVEFEKVWEDEANPSDYASLGHMFRTYTQGWFKIQKENSILFIDMSSGENRSWEFFENDNTVENVDLPEIGDDAAITSSANYYYIATGTDLYKVDIDTHEHSKLLTTGQYDIYTMSVDASDNVQFSGLRLSDDRKIFGEISSTGTVTEIDEELNRGATVLLRLD